MCSTAQGNNNKNSAAPDHVVLRFSENPPTLYTCQPLYENVCLLTEVLARVFQNWFPRCQLNWNTVFRKYIIDSFMLKDIRKNLQVRNVVS